MWTFIFDQTVVDRVVEWGGDQMISNQGAGARVYCFSTQGYDGLCDGEDREGCRVRLPQGHMPLDFAVGP